MLALSASFHFMFALRSVCNCPPPFAKNITLRAQAAWWIYFFFSSHGKPLHVIQLWSSAENDLKLISILIWQWRMIYALFVCVSNVFVYLLLLCAFKQTKRKSRIKIDFSVCLFVQWLNSSCEKLPPSSAHWSDITERAKNRLIRGHEECVCELQWTFINPTTFCSSMWWMYAWGKWLCILEGHQIIVVLQAEPVGLK